MDDIIQILTNFIQQHVGENRRYKSWEHCYYYFNKNHYDLDIDKAALHLYAYLASWGMFRNSFLKNYDYRILSPIIIKLRQDKYEKIRETQILNENVRIVDYVELVFELKEEIEGGLPNNDYGNPPSDTLVTKIMLGTLGCTPGFDRFFLNGLAHNGFPPNLPFEEESFSNLINHIRIEDNADNIRAGQEFVQQQLGQNYPVMKIVDMYFWQKGLVEQPEE